MPLDKARPGLFGFGFRVVCGGPGARGVDEGDDLGAALSGVDARAVVVAVTPFTSPPESFDGFDGTFYVGIVEQLVALLPAGSRVIIVSVTAIARLDDGSLIADHEELFPGWLRPFSDAHARGADRLLGSPTLDGTVLIPTAGLGVHDTDSAAEPVLVPEPVTIDDAMAPLDHAALARAVADQVTPPGRQSAPSRGAPVDR
ncbi:hypothetical protein [Tsukamurella ocularis]|uniref:hypothetical protein n=1 Tax=Tsukamurella ocularis TaxID=1970234 RepID=UPI00216942CC|nr:hypothetical protein [Tsukamurella ocularis]MCS3780028.1 hypothetical protein [Tsukamurella ocularis]MCS3786418.1 hypothetical protein [Tsukamurella ocularis]MCS3849782.1 hypothetical protein [Tsukamurella ocularis]